MKLHAMPLRDKEATIMPQRRVEPKLLIRALLIKVIPPEHRDEALKAV